MPQMAPMSWILLFLFFSLMLITINMLNYYLYNPKCSMINEGKTFIIKSKTWTW
uniref:ATP synthase complex subunit 8 n=2 Tax=Libellulidae TaxID=6964 RepID=A0A4Y5SFJ5_9ODON|nr:ATP synthase F0 subunit 8 [Orthetrum melania]QDA21675.1 ATP synthase F0 subunit 8 [Orthetrum melania]QHZ87456.1 ATP synthase F0 subunit 8 [Sympetrum eroticum]